jgi:hypothetical protein
MRKYLIPVVVCLTAAACDKNPSTPSPPSPPPLPSNFTQTQTGSLGPNTGNFHRLNVDRPGNLALEVSWPGNADLDVYLADAGCTDVFQQRTCQFFGQADSFTQNPERVTRTVSGGSSFNVWVVNASSFTSANYNLNIRIDYAPSLSPALTPEGAATVTRGGTAFGTLK